MLFHTLWVRPKLTSDTLVVRGGWGCLFYVRFMPSLDNKNKNANKVDFMEGPRNIRWA